MEGWNSYSLGEICQDISYGYTASATKRNTGCKFLRITDIQDAHIDWASVPYCEITKSEFEKNKLEIGDIVIARTGNSTGETSIIKDDINAVFASYLIRFRIVRKIANPLYVSFVLRTNDWRNFIESIKGGSAQPGANAKILSTFELTCPPLPLQHRIAEILGALDDKIELNRQMNQTLEHMAQALYKHYFVDDIDPENLPEGWRNGNVLELADLLSGGTPKTEIQEYWNGGIDWISAKDITPNNKCFIVETGKKISPEGLAKSAAKLLPRYTTVITARGTVGNYCMLSREMAISQSNYGLKSKTGNSDFFIFQLVGNLVDKMKQQAYGTVFDTITTKTFQELEIVIPPKEVIINFENVIKPLFELRLSTTFEVKNLSNIRDYLLPKLISGDFIPSALQTIEQAL